MRILESTIERLAWYLVFIVFIVDIILLIISINIFRGIQNQQGIIVKNQVNQTVALKDYIACLLSINPKANIATQERACFDKAPDIKN